jgi:glycosyltransferase involved in cell wall biosynthesis
MYNFSAVPLSVAAACRIPGRILHVHTDGGSKYDGRRWSPARAIAHRAALAAATHGIAVSEASGRRFFGSRWSRDPQIALLHCGVDTVRLTRAVDGDRLRAALGIPAGSAVLGHVGRLAPVKNQRFLLRVFGRFRQAFAHARLLLIGDGPDRTAIEREVERLGLAGTVHVLGARTDVPELLRGVIDVFLLPSRHEGLPLSLIEAQLAGRRCIVSDAVTDEAVVRDELVVRLPLDGAEDVWVRHVTEAVENRPTVGLVVDAQDAILTEWSLEASARRLAGFYDHVLGGPV